MNSLVLVFLLTLSAPRAALDQLKQAEANAYNAPQDTWNRWLAQKPRLSTLPIRLQERWVRAALISAWRRKAHDEVAQQLLIGLPFKHYIQERDLSATYINFLGAYYKAKQHPEMARASFHCAYAQAKQKIQHKKITRNLANIHLYTGDYEQAKQLYQTLLQRIPNATLLNNLGIVALLEQDYNTALTLFDRAIEENKINHRLDKILLVETNKLVALLGKNDLSALKDLYLTVSAQLREANNHKLVAMVKAVSLLASQTPLSETQKSRLTRLFEQLENPVIQTALYPFVITHLPDLPAPKATPQATPEELTSWLSDCS